MVKQNAITNIGIKRSRYFLSFHFLSFLPFRRFSYDLKVFFHTNLHMGNLQESDCPFVSSWNLKPLFCWLSFAVTCYNLLCQSLYHSLSIDVSLICLFFYKRPLFPVSIVKPGLHSAICSTFFPHVMLEILWWVKSTPHIFDQV